MNIQNEAPQFSEEGREKRLYINITQLQLFDFVRLILISGNTYVVGKDDLYDIETGKLVPASPH